MLTSLPRRFTTNGDGHPASMRCIVAQAAPTGPLTQCHLPPSTLPVSRAALHASTKSTRIHGLSQSRATSASSGGLASSTAGSMSSFRLPPKASRAVSDAPLHENPVAEPAIFRKQCIAELGKPIVSAPYKIFGLTPALVTSAALPPSRRHQEMRERLAHAPFNRLR